MFRITYSQETSDAWRARRLPGSYEKQQRRVYRWGATWAYAAPWKVEQRIPVSDTVPLVEICTPTSDLQPPFDVDDMWEEEVVLLPHIEYTGLLSLVGTAAELLAVMEREGLPRVSLPFRETIQTAQTAQTQPRHTARPMNDYRNHNNHNNHNNRHKPRSQCLISD